MSASASYSLPSRLYAVVVAGHIIALFTDELEVNTYVRVLRGPESEVKSVSVIGRAPSAASADNPAVVREQRSSLSR